MIVKSIKKMTAEALLFITRYCPHHPELHDGRILNWQHGYKFVCYEQDKIVGFMTLLPDGKIGWGATIILNMGQPAIYRWMVSRQLLKACEKTGLLYCAAGLVSEIIEPYKKYGLNIRDDYMRMFMRPLKKRVWRYLNKPGWWMVPSHLMNWIFSPSRPKKLFTRTGVFKSQYLNYKLSQPGKSYFSFGDDDAHIIFRGALKENIRLIKICRLKGRMRDRIDLLASANEFANFVDADAIIALDHKTRTWIYRQGGLWVWKKYPVALHPSIKEDISIDFFTGDLDNLW